MISVGNASSRHHAVLPSLAGPRRKSVAFLPNLENEASTENHRISRDKLFALRNRETGFYRVR